MSSSSRCAAVRQRSSCSCSRLPPTQLQTAAVRHPPRAPPLQLLCLCFLFLSLSGATAAETTAGAADRAVVARSKDALPAAAQQQQHGGRGGWVPWRWGANSTAGGHARRLAAAQHGGSMITTASTRAWALRPRRSGRHLLGNSTAPPPTPDAATTATNGSSSTNSSSSKSTGEGSSLSSSLNPWYDQHLLSGSGGAWGSALLYGSVNGQRINVSILDAGGDDTIVAGNAALTSAAPDPPPYEYPPPTHHPAVCFTAVLQRHPAAGALSAEEQAAFSAAINAFLAPLPGVVITNTSIIAQAAADSGLWLPAATAFLGGEPALQDFLAATLQSDPNLVFPTAAWGTGLRVTNIRAAQPALADALSFAWSVGDYSNCSVLCGVGVQSRAVACVDSAGNAADASMCSGGGSAPAPAASRACQTQPCAASLPTGFSLLLGPWGPCNASCSYASRTRTATCVSAEGYIGSLAACNVTLADLAAQLWEPCALPPCPTFVWAYSDWACSNEAGCGGGVASRNASCMLSASRRAVAPELCDPVQVDNATQPCAQAACLVYYWRARELADCLPEDPGWPCGRYLQRRGFDCVNMTGGEPVPNINCGGPKPVLGEVECARPPAVNCTSSSGDGSASTDEQQQQQPAAALSDSGGGASTGSDQGAATWDGGSPGSSTPSGAGNSSASVASTSDAAAGFDAHNGTASSNSTLAPAAAGANAANASSDGGAPGPAGGAGEPASTSTPTPASAGGGSSSSSSSTALGTTDLGPGAALPAWLLSDPTPALRALMDCPLGSAMSADGRCCNGSAIDAKGSCCEGGAVDACGVCGGSGRVLDALGACCASVLDAQGVCCAGGALDECGVCNGTSACDVKADLVVRLAPAVLYLVPASNANRRLRAALQDDVAAALAAATGRPLDKSRLSIVLSAFSSSHAAGDGGAGGGFGGASAPISAAEADEEQQAAAAPSVSGGGAAGGGLPHDIAALLPDGSASTGGAPVGLQPVAALPAPGAAVFAGAPGAAGTPLQGGDTLALAPEQLDAPATHANVAAQRVASAALLLESHRHPRQQLWPTSAPTEGTAAPLGRQPERGVRSADAAAAAAAAAGPHHPASLDADSGALQLVHQSLAAALHQLGVGPLRQLRADAADASSSSELSASNALVASITLRAPPGSGSSSGGGGGSVDTGTALQALSGLVGRQLAVPGALAKLEYREVASLLRAGTCGDGVCQVNERVASGNPDACPADCALPFLSCPPYAGASRGDAAAGSPPPPPCNGLGVCYNAIGSCACSTGYAGPDCSACAAGYKRVSSSGSASGGAFCVLGAVLAPPRTCVGGVCSGNGSVALDLRPYVPPRSLAGGQAAVATTVGGTLAASLAVAAWIFRARGRRMLRDAEAAAIKGGANYQAE